MGLRKGCEEERLRVEKESAMKAADPKGVVEEERINREKEVLRKVCEEERLRVEKESAIKAADPKGVAEEERINREKEVLRKVCKEERLCSEKESAMKAVANLRGPSIARERPHAKRRIKREKE